MKNPITNHLVVQDSLYYLVPASGASNDKSVGMIDGLVSALMGVGLSFEEAIAILGEEWKKMCGTLMWDDMGIGKVPYKRVPDPWIEEMRHAGFEFVDEDD